MLLPLQLSGLALPRPPPRRGSLHSHPYPTPPPPLFLQTGENISSDHSSGIISELKTFFFFFFLVKAVTILVYDLLFFCCFFFVFVFLLFFFKNPAE